MSEYNRHIEEYRIYTHSSSSTLVSEKDWGNTNSALEYFKKYWLQEDEYTNIWKPIQNKIFINQSTLPNLGFELGFKIIAIKGGCLFVEEEFLQLQNALKEIHETHFVVIQNTQTFTEGEPMFRMKFPVDISWEEITSGNYISAILFEMNYNEYFVFGTNENWFKYSATDYSYPIDLIGAKEEYLSIFKKYFKQTKEDKKYISDHLPLNYRNLLAC